MSLQVSQLIEVINKEILCLEKFLTLLTEEQKFVVENDIDSLQKLVEEQEKTIRDERKLEDERIKLTDSLAEKLKIDKADVNISRLIELVEESYSTKLRELQSTLASLYAKLERQRKKNEFLIKQSMKYLDKSINIFSGLEGRDINYSIFQQKNKNVQFV
ncbi:MAG: flagellar protein FlgN [candidate division Zixibacteria bacterium]|nr:flagellar protein FlgN [candidate division Zixibacteria bacterium]